MASCATLDMAVAAVSDWLHAAGFRDIVRTGWRTPDICLTAAGRGRGSIAVLRPRIADLRMYGRLLSAVHRAQLHYDTVYATTTTANGLKYARQALMVRGVGILRVVPGRGAVLEMDARKV